MSQPLHPQPTNPGQPSYGATYSDQQYPGQPYPGQPYPGGPNPGEPFSGHQPYPGQSRTDQLPYPTRPDSRYPAPPPSQAAAPRPRKRRLVLKLVLLAIAGLVIAAVLVGRQPEPVRVPDSGAIAQPGTLSVFDLQPGDCYNTTQAPPPPGETQPISSVEAVACTVPHTDQVIAKISYSPAEAASGVPDTKADADCNNEFQAKLDPNAFGDPTLAPGRLFPADAATWASKPVVACIVFSDAPITRSLLR